MSDIDFPMFFSVYIKPGYNLSALEEFGFISVWDLFKGQASEASEANVSIEGKILFTYIQILVILAKILG